MTKQVNVTRNETREATSQESLNTELLTIKVTDTRTGETIVDEKAANILYTAVTADTDEELTFASGLGGEFSVETMVQAMETVLKVLAINFKEHADFGPADMVQLTASMMGDVVQSVYSEDERQQGIAKILAQLARESRK